MFKTAILATSALVAITSIGLAAGGEYKFDPTRLPAGWIAITSHANHHVVVKVPRFNPKSAAHETIAPDNEHGHTMFDNLNRKFLSAYGYFTYAYYYSGSTYQESGYQNAAFPVMGDSFGHKKMKVPTYTYSGSASTYSAGIYSNTSSGHPGSAIDSGSCTAPSGSGYCTAKLHRVVIPLATVWLSLRGHASPGCQCEADGIWLMEDKKQVEDQVQYEYGYNESTTGGYNTNYNSGWLTSSSSTYLPGALVK